MPVSSDVSTLKKSSEPLEPLAVGIAVVGFISSLVLAFFSKTLTKKTSLASMLGICFSPLGLGALIATAILCCKTKKPAQQAVRQQQIVPQVPLHTQPQQEEGAAQTPEQQPQTQPQTPNQQGGVVAQTAAQTAGQQPDTQQDPLWQQQEEPLGQLLQEGATRAAAAAPAPVLDEDPFTDTVRNGTPFSSSEAMYINAW